jgi:hypothetical protein
MLLVLKFFSFFLVCDLAKVLNSQNFVNIPFYCAKNLQKFF